MSVINNPDYEGLMDYVVVADFVRSPMGVFQTIYANKEKRWNAPIVKFASVASAIAISRYPFPLNPTTLTEINHKFEE